MIGRGYSNVHWGDLLSRNHKTLGFAVDDAHCFTRPFLPLDLTRACIQVKSTELTAESLLENIKLGLFYSSTGPIIYGIVIDDNEIRVSSSPARSISFISDKTYGRNDSVEKGIIEESTYIVQGEESYVRVEITDWNGGKAWSNPIYVE